MSGDGVEGEVGRKEAVALQHDVELVLYTEEEVRQQSDYSKLSLHKQILDWRYPSHTYVILA